MGAETLERAYGLADRREAAALTGREFLQAIVEGRLPQPPISRTLGFWLAEAGDGFAAFEGEPSEALLNPLGTVHGGWALTILDSVTACAVQTRLPAGVGYTTVETKGNFSKAILPDTGRVRAEARVVTLGRTIGTAEGWVCDAEGRVLAHGTSTLMILGPR